jgi:hypothetical protein
VHANDHTCLSLNSCIFSDFRLRSLEEGLNVLSENLAASDNRTIAIAIAIPKGNSDSDSFFRGVLADFPIESVAGNTQKSGGTGPIPAAQAYRPFNREVFHFLESRN